MEAGHELANWIIDQIFFLFIVCSTVKRQQMQALLPFGAQNELQLRTIKLTRESCVRLSESFLRSIALHLFVAFVALQAGVQVAAAPV
jgi:hypothetical protein